MRQDRTDIPHGSDRADTFGRPDNTGRHGQPDHGDTSRRKKRLVIVAALAVFAAIVLVSVCIPAWERRSAAPVIAYADLEPLPDGPVMPAHNIYDAPSVPTYLTKIGDLYFLVDCYHDQIIYHDNLEDPLTDWLVMTDEINKGHTIAGDGFVYLADDTENNRILVFEKRDGVFVHTQTFSDIGSRPHYIVYDEPTDTFYAWSSMSGEMYLFCRDKKDDTSQNGNRMFLSEIRRIEQLDNVYVRSFTIMDDEIWFVSGSSSILCADLETFQIKKTYPVPDSMAGMIQLTRIEDYYYITVSTDITGNQDYATIVRTRDLSGLITGDYEDVYAAFIGGGTPYYITCFDGAYYLTEHRIPGHSVWRFRVRNNEITDVETVY